MNKNMFYRLNTMHGDKYLGEEYDEVLYDYISTGGNIYKYEVRISKEEFINIISVIRNILIEKFTEEEIKYTFISYIQLLMSYGIELGYIDDKIIKKYINDLFIEEKYIKKGKRIVKRIKKSINGN